MRSITTAFVLVAAFVLHLCASEPEPKESHHGKPKPHHPMPDRMPPMMMSSMSPDMMMKMSKSPMDAVIDVDVSNRYRERCRRRLSGYVRGDYIDSEDCMYFCGFIDVGVTDSRGNLNRYYVRDLVTAGSRDRITSKIMNCASGSSWGGVCSKARRNVRCIEQYVSDFSVESEMMKIMS
ncbi:uncharacterized protein LOC135850025 [Planococcus citri]|uniref:uncharacterized protein LOC135850025 n=1 Tax=Planococcus citri TaxID=170843 RepID=UPI0031F82D8A